MIAAGGDDSTLGTLPLGWSLLVGLLIVAVVAVCVVRIVRDRHRDKLADAWEEGYVEGGGGLNIMKNPYREGSVQ